MQEQSKHIIEFSKEKLGKILTLTPTTFNIGGRDISGYLDKESNLFYACNNDNEIINILKLEKV